MEESKTTENKHAILKTVTSVTEDKQRKNCRKDLPFTGEPKTDTGLEVMKEMVVNTFRQGLRICTFTVLLLAYVNLAHQTFVYKPQISQLVLKYQMKRFV